MNHPKATYLRERPRGLGLLQLPTGISDERSGPYFPGLYIAGDKVGEKPQTVPDVHLPGQKADFSGRSAFNPFTNSISAVYTEDLTDGWGIGYAAGGINGLGLNVRNNYEAYSNLNLGVNDGNYQPFLNTLTVGGEYDYMKMKEVAGSLFIPILGVDEFFDLDARLLIKGSPSTINSAIEFPATLSDENERLAYVLKMLNYSADRHMHYGHVVPNVNMMLLGKDRIVKGLKQNNLNPTMIG